jgi:hypothetical protein
MIMNFALYKCKRIKYIAITTWRHNPEDSHDLDIFIQGAVPLLPSEKVQILLKMSRITEILSSKNAENFKHLGKQ